MKINGKTQKKKKKKNSEKHRPKDQLYLFIFCYWHIYPPIMRKRRTAVRARLGVAGHLSTTLR